MLSQNTDNAFQALQFDSPQELPLVSDIWRMENWQKQSPSVCTI